MTRNTLAGAATLALGIMLAAPAWSRDSDNVEINITGTAVPVCLLSKATQTGAVNATLTDRTLKIDKFIDEQNATVLASSAEITVANAMCNYAATVTIASQNGGLKSDGQTQDLSGKFLNKVPYVVNAKWGDVALPALDTSSQIPSVSKDMSGANSGSLVITISIAAGNTPVLEGQFSDYLTVKIGAEL